MPGAKIYGAVAGAVFIALLVFTPIRSQAPQAPDAAKAAEDLHYSVKVKSDSRWGRGKKLILEFTVVNEGAQPVTLNFAGS